MDVQPGSQHSCILPLFSFLAILSLSASAFGQVDRGSIVGTVSDPSGARVAEASVVVTNLESNQSYELKTDSEGNYSAPLLKIGTLFRASGKARVQRARSSQTWKLG